jgi:Spy/CpxP family protein refolding chaperone
MRMHSLYTIALAALLAGSALAQSAGSGRMAPTAAEIVANRVARLTKLLTLTATQQTQATTIFTTEESSLSALRTSLQTARTGLATAVKANDTAGISAAAVQIGGITTQEVQAQGTADAAFYVLLTADQKTKYDELKSSGFGGMRGRGGRMSRPGQF